MRCWSIRPRNEGRILPASNGHLLDCHLSRLSLGCTGSMGNLHSSLFAFGLNYQDASGTLRKQVCCLYRHIQISMSIFAGPFWWVFSTLWVATAIYSLESQHISWTLQLGSRQSEPNAITMFHRCTRWVWWATSSRYDISLRGACTNRSQKWKWTIHMFR